MSETLIALSTPAGRGALAVLRISGPEAFSAVQQVWRGKRLADQKGHSLLFGHLLQAGEILDEVVLSIYRGPRSFTGEDVVEISLHNSTYVIQEAIQLFLEVGLRLARPGEYSERAFTNGKIDLAQTEAIADVIEAETAQAHRTAINQMRGGFSRELQALRQELIDFAALIELELDFGEEDVEFADRTQLLDLLSRVQQSIQRLIASFKLGNVIKNGIPVVIAGRPNAGKSTLLNALLNEEKAIVSDIAGTTRDVIEDELIIDGLVFRFMDTAGLRDTTDAVEAIGVQRSYDRMQKADLILYLFDVSDSNPTEVAAQLDQLDAFAIPYIALANKVDLLATPQLPASLASIPQVISFSAQNSTDIDQLKRKLVETVQLPSFQSGDTIVTNARHHASLQAAAHSLEQAEQGIHQQLTGDLLALDIRQALHHLGTITGEVSNEEVLGSIFSRFCIGK